MRTLSLVIVLALASTACIARVAPAPQAPAQPVATQPQAKPEPKLVDKFIALVPALGKCDAWTSDAVICHPSPTQLLYCKAPADGRPYCELALDWTPAPPQAAQAEPAKPEPPKTELKKK